MSEVTWRVPGRLEVLGKHTDYAGGQVLICPVEQAVTVTAVAIDEPAGTVVARSRDAAATVRLGAGVATAFPSGHWGRYVRTVVDRLTANFGVLRAAELTVTSQVPLASGLSSSSALLVGCALALADLNKLPATLRWQGAMPDRLALAGYLATVENGRTWGPLAGALGVGTQGGSEDHTAMLCGVEGTLGHYEFDPLGLVRQVAFPPGWAFVVAVSGVRAEKTGAALASYNAAARAVADLLARWNAVTGRAEASLAAAWREDAARLTAIAAEEPALARRLAHFVVESTECVPAGAQAVAVGDAAAFGEVAARSQRGAEDLLGNQVPATIDLARSALALGAWAASSFGAGFGGSVWALVGALEADAFAGAWLADHRRRHPDLPEATTLVTRPGAPAARIAAGESDGPGSRAYPSPRPRR